MANILHSSYQYIPYILSYDGIFDEIGKNSSIASNY